MAGTPIRRLIVVRGLDTGAQLVVDGSIKLVGRSREAQLVLNDRSVSRHHFHIHATEEGAYVRVCRGAADLLVGGREVDEANVKVGDSLVAGDTVFSLLGAEGEPSTPSPWGEHDGATTIGALMTGPAAEVRGLAGIFALNEALSAATDAPTIEAALVFWAKGYGACESVEFAATGAEQPVATEKKRIIESGNSRGGTRILVPAPGTPTGWLGYSTKLAPARITDSLRRLLVVASGLCASRFMQLSMLTAAKEEGDSFRQQAVGSARAFLGTSEAAVRLGRMIPKYAASDVTVLLLGETGAGKSFVARLIHESGPRRGEPLRVINCASIPETLIESELFGHERGAFTGAVTAQRGAFEAAGKGTVLLDEIGELSLASQAKLLRVLEEKRFERVGSNRQLTLEARVLAATNRDLESMVASGDFRKDLFFRISGLTATVPPLRERGDDLVLLAERILVDLAPTGGRRIDGFSQEALEAIRRYPWPGNVRELRNAIEHAVVLGDGPLIVLSDFPQVVQAVAEVKRGVGAGEGAAEGDPFVVRLPADLGWLEERAIEAALLVTGGNQTKAAALLGMNRHTLGEKRRKAGI